MFRRRSLDGTETVIPLDDFYSSPSGSACWIIGGGPSLTESVAQQIVETPIPRFCVNLAGTGLLRPHFWTSYDPTCRFLKSIYLDASILKFVHRGKAMNLIPETNYKVCEAPGVCVIQRNRSVGYHDFLKPQSGDQVGVTDWQDSLVQAIDIAYRIGFRQLFLVGTEMAILPSKSLLSAAELRGVKYQRIELLKDFCKRCNQVGISQAEIQDRGLGRQYHFSESKPIASAISTDFHYHRVVNSLRLSRTAMSQAGLRLISVNPHSRLNSFFERWSLKKVSDFVKGQVGDPKREIVVGKYTSKPPPKTSCEAPMQDFQPHFWGKNQHSNPDRPGMTPVTSAHPLVGKSTVTDRPYNNLLTRQNDLKYESSKWPLRDWEIEIPVNLQEEG